MKKLRLGVLTQDIPSLKSMISDFPLEESLKIVSLDDPIKDNGSHIYIEVKEGNIYSYPDWYNQSLPFLFPVLPLNKGNLVGLLFYHLGLGEDAISVSEQTEVQSILKGLYEGSNLDWLEPYRGQEIYGHNRAVISYYYQLEDMNRVQESFREAITTTQDSYQKAYSLKHQSIFKQEAGIPLDMSMFNDLLKENNLHASAQHALQLELMKEELTHKEREGIPLSTSTKEELGALCSFYKAENSSLIVADLLGEMSWIAAQDGNFTESLNYINQAIEIYLKEELEMLSAELYTKKAGILHQWAKSGMPHFYQEAVKSFQEALKTIKQSEFPYWFADIHHRLGVLYAEMPEEQQKRSIWAAVSATSFQEALAFFSKEEYPYEYANVCHNYATALINYPSAVKSDNIEKALHYFNESLEIRTAEELPKERIVTLLNYLEASWEASNINDTMERVRLQDMRDKSEEILNLTEEPSMIQRASEHLESIKKLDQQLSNA